MADRPDEDATAAEIAEWMEEDFGEVLAEEIKQAVEDDDTGEWFSRSFGPERSAPGSISVSSIGSFWSGFTLQTIGNKWKK